MASLRPKCFTDLYAIAIRVPFSLSYKDARAPTAEAIICSPRSFRIREGDSPYKGRHEAKPTNDQHCTFKHDMYSITPETTHEAAAGYR